MTFELEIFNNSGQVPISNIAAQIIQSLFQTSISLNAKHEKKIGSNQDFFRQKLSDVNIKKILIVYIDFFHI